jgi:hypothetical protein
VFKDITFSLCLSQIIPNHNAPSYISETIFLLSACLHVHFRSNLTWNFLSEPFIHFTSLTSMQHTPPISSTLVRSTNHEFPHYAVFSILLWTFFILGPNIFLSIPFLNTLSLCYSLSGGPYFTSMKNKRQNNNSVYFNFYVSK